MADLLQSSEIMFSSFEPKVQNRFIMYLDGIPSFLIKKTDRPKISGDAKVLDHINIQRKYRGKSKWSDISIELYDPIVPSGAQAVMEWIRLHHESVTGRDGYADFYKKDVTINVLGPVGDKVEEWTLKGAFISGETSFGTLDWTNDGEFIPITLQLSMDYCILQF